MNTFNIVVVYKGLGKIDVAIPKFGTRSIDAQRPIQLLNAPMDVVEYLRTLRPVRIEHYINKIDERATVVLDYLNRDSALSRYNFTNNVDFRGVNIGTVDRTAIRSAEGPLELPKKPEISTQSVDTDNREPAEGTEDTTEENTPTQNSFDISLFEIPKGKYEGKKLSELTEKQLKSVKRTQEDNVKSIIDAYLDLIAVKDNDE